MCTCPFPHPLLVQWACAISPMRLPLEALSSKIQESWVTCIYFVLRCYVPCDHLGGLMVYLNIVYDGRYSELSRWRRWMWLTFYSEVHISTCVLVCVRGKFLENVLKSSSLCDMQVGPDRDFEAPICSDKCNIFSPLTAHADFTLFK